MKKEKQIKMPDITCMGIHCGKIIKFPSYVNADQYDGDLRCPECKSLMHISLKKSVAVKYRLKDDKSETAEGWKTWSKLQSALEKPDTERNG